MAVIQLQDPLSAAAEAVGGYLEKKRSNVLDQQARDYVQKRDTRRDVEADRSFELDQQRAADTHAVTQSTLATEEQSRKLAQAKEAYDAQMRPLQVEAQRIRNKLDSGALVDQKDLHTLRSYEITSARVAAQIAAKFGVSEAQLRLDQGRAGIDATRAGIGATQASTAATTQRTTQDAQLFPGALQEQQVNIEGGRLTNEGRRLQNTFERQQVANPVTDPHLQQDYRAQLSSYTQRIKNYDQRAAHNQLQPGEKPPEAPVSPEDFTATLADSVDALKQNPSDLPKMLAAVDANPGLSPYQKRHAHLALSAAVKGVPVPPQSVPYGLELGGSHAAGPFQFPAFPGNSAQR